MRPFGVVLALERIEVPLLRGAIGADWFDGLALERAMHSLVRPVFLVAPRTDPLMHDAEAHPPAVEVREAVERLRCERDAVVGPQSDRQAIRAEGPLEDRPTRDGLRREQSAAREEKARALISDRERIAVLAIARAELPLLHRTPPEPTGTAAAPPGAPRRRPSP